MHDQLFRMQIHATVALSAVVDDLRGRLSEHRRRAEAGEVTSQMILVAVFATLAIAVGIIIYDKTINQAEAVPTEPSLG